MSGNYDAPQACYWRAQHGRACTTCCFVLASALRASLAQEAGATEGYRSVVRRLSRCAAREEVAYVFQVHDTLHQWLHYGHGDPAPQVFGPLRHRPSEAERLDRFFVADLRRSGGASAHRRPWRWAVLACGGRLRRLYGICACGGCVRCVFTIAPVISRRSLSLSAESTRRLRASSLNSTMSALKVNTMGTLG